MVFGTRLRALVVPADVGELESGAVAFAAPTVLRVEREQAWIELGKAARTRRARTLH
jgi:hypothetical protein